MSDRMTEISSPGNQGIGEWGSVSREDMIRRYRAYYEHVLKDAQEALSYADEDLVVETFLGPHARKNLEVVE
jgi:hypothetical protein